jgi:hypothetical protein
VLILIEMSQVSFFAWSHFVYIPLIIWVLYMYIRK